MALSAVLIIFAISYTTYAFSRYRGEILPGVHVDVVSISGMTPPQAKGVLRSHLDAIAGVPIEMTYGPNVWKPNKQNIGVEYDEAATVTQAMSVGRQGSFFEQLLDRLPLHPDHSIPLIYHLNETQLRAYIQQRIAKNVFLRTSDATLSIRNHHVILDHAIAGLQLDVPGTEGVIHAALGSLSKETKVVPVVHVQPVITDAYARRIRDRVEAFLSHPPVINVAKRVFATDRSVYAPGIISFKTRPRSAKQPAAILLYVDPNAVAAYVSQLASQIDRTPVNARMRFSGTRVKLVSPRRTGRTLNQAVAQRRLLAAITSLRPNARLRFPVTTTQPSIDLSNPASLGISTLLGTGETSFAGAGARRLDDINNIASRLNDVLISPGQDVSFNVLVGTDWPDEAYNDGEKESSGRLVPTSSGGVQQVATTFLRALYVAGLNPLEVHNHPFRLAFYEPPVGLDAVVDPANNEDLRFHNNTHRYLLLETRVEPIRKELYVYVYGPRLHWSVAVDKLGKVLKTYPHGAALVQQDSTLSPGQVVQTAFAHDGMDTAVDRTITFPNGDVQHKVIRAHYQPWRAIMKVGPSVPTPVKSAKARATPTPGPTPQPSPTPTFSH